MNRLRCNFSFALVHRKLSDTSLPHEAIKLAVYLVRLHVFLDVGFLREGSSAHNALKGLLARVGADVLLQVKVLREGLVAVLTQQLLLRL